MEKLGNFILLFRLVPFLASRAQYTKYGADGTLTGLSCTIISYLGQKASLSRSKKQYVLKFASVSSVRYRRNALDLARRPLV
jgi:hypothetical protein